MKLRQPVGSLSNVVPIPTDVLNGHSEDEKEDQPPLFQK